VPEPLLPPGIALQNPELIGGTSFWVYPALGKIMVSIDNHGDEMYRPMLIPILGGLPEPAFPQLKDARLFSTTAAVIHKASLVGACSVTAWPWPGECASTLTNSALRPQWVTYPTRGSIVAA
jgi:hypothetical protein